MIPRRSLFVLLAVCFTPAHALAGVEADVEAGVVFSSRNDFRIPGNGGTEVSLVHDLSTPPARLFA